MPRGAFWVPAAMPPCHDAQARPCQVARAACGLAEASRRHIMGPAGALRRPPPQIADIRSTWPHLHVASCKLWIFILSSGRGVHPQVLAPVPLRLAVPARCHPAASGRYCRRLAVELHVDRHAANPLSIVIRDRAGPSLCRRRRRSAWRAERTTGPLVVRDCPVSSVPCAICRYMSSLMQDPVVAYHVFPGRFWRRGACRYLAVPRACPSGRIGGVEPAEARRRLIFGPPYLGGVIRAYAAGTKFVHALPKQHTALTGSRHGAASGAVATWEAYGGYRLRSGRPLLVPRRHE